MSRFSVFAALIIVPFIFGILSQEIPAQLAVSPLVLETSVYPGAVKDHSVVVSNQASETLSCQVTPYGMELQQGGLPVAVEEAARSCSRWITVEPSRFSLTPGQAIQLRCRFNVPKGTLGGYYAIISIHGQPGAVEEEADLPSGLRAGIRFSYRSLLPVLLAVPGGELRAEITAAQPIISCEGPGGEQRIQLPLINSGNIHARIRGTAEIRSLANQPIERFELAAGRGYLLPDHQRIFTQKINSRLPDGQYVMNVELTMERSPRPMRKVFDLYVQEGAMKVGEPDEATLAQLARFSSGLLVSPSEVSFDLRPGARRMDAVTIANLTRETIPLEIKVMEWVRQADGADHVLTGKAEHGRSVADSISLRLDSMQLRPLGKTRIPITLTLPEGFSGEGYAAVAFDRADRELTDAPDQVARRSTRIRALASRTGRPAVELLSFTAERAPNGVIEFLAPIANTGDVGIFPDVSITIQNIENTEVGRITLPDLRNSLVQAGTERLIRAEYRKILDPGSYTALLTIRYGDGSHPLSARASFVVPESKTEAGETAQKSVVSASDSQN